MKLIIDIKYGTLRRIVMTYQIGPSIDKVYEFIKKVQALADELK